MASSSTRASTERQRQQHHHADRALPYMASFEWREQSLLNDACRGVQMLADACRCSMQTFRSAVQHDAHQIGVCRGAGNRGRQTWLPTTRYLGRYLPYLYGNFCSQKLTTGLLMEKLPCRAALGCGCGRSTRRLLISALRLRNGRVAIALSSDKRQLSWPGSLSDRPPGDGG